MTDPGIAVNLVNTAPNTLRTTPNIQESWSNVKPFLTLICLHYNGGKLAHLRSIILIGATLGGWLFAPCAGCPRIADWPDDANLIDLFACVSDGYFPDVGGPQWETMLPDELGWNTDALPDFYDYMDAQNTRALLVLHHGRIVLEQYWGLNLSSQPFDANSYWYWASAGKTLTAALVGIAQYQGYLSLDDPTSLYLGSGWTSLNESDEGEILIRHQITMTSGLDDGVDDPYCTDPACLVFLADPGDRWAYHNGPYTLLDGVLVNATGAGFNAYFNQNLRDPIGMLGFWAYSDFNHVFYSTPRDMARFGLLILNQGIWAGQPILEDSAFVEAMTMPSQSLNPSYGYLWWLNGQESYLVPGLQFPFPGPLTPNAPDDMVAAMGKNGQLINVVPSMDLVVVRMGDNPGQSLVPMIFQNEMWAYLSDIICP